MALDDSGLRHASIAARRTSLESGFTVSDSDTLGHSAVLESTGGHPRKAHILTWYRLLVTSITLSLGTWKAVAEFDGQAVISNSLDVIVGVGLALVYVHSFILPTDVATRNCSKT